MMAKLLGSIATGALVAATLTLSSAPGARAVHREGLLTQQAGPYRYVEVVVPRASMIDATQITLESPDAPA